MIESETEIKQIFYAVTHAQYLGYQLLDVAEWSGDQVRISIPQENIEFQFNASLTEFLVTHRDSGTTEKYIVDPSQQQNPEVRRLKSSTHQALVIYYDQELRLPERILIETESSLFEFMACQPQWGRCNDHTRKIKN